MAGPFQLRGPSSGLGLLRSIQFALVINLVFSLMAVQPAACSIWHDDLHHRTVIPSAVQNTTSYAQFTFNPAHDHLDGPKLSAINTSVFDWWYFDAVSATDPRTSVVLTFFSAPATAFPFLDPTQQSVLIAYLWVSFANGTIFAEYLPADVATVISVGEGSSGQWHGTGLQWHGDESAKRYQVQIESKAMGVSGVLELDTITQPHLPCGYEDNRNEQTLEIAPHLGWANIIPDALGMANLDILGTHVDFTGPAYHDKNWSDRPFTSSVLSWYWGHGRLGPYSLVWFYYIGLADDGNPQTHVSGFVARDGQTLVSSCAVDVVTVRPLPEGSRYPPHAGDTPSGYLLEFELATDEGRTSPSHPGGRGQEVLQVDVTASMFVAGDGQYYMRWTGEMEGKVVVRGSSGEEYEQSEVYRGVALFEQFALEP